MAVLDVSKFLMNMNKSAVSVRFVNRAMTASSTVSLGYSTIEYKVWSSHYDSEIPLLHAEITF